MCETRPSASRGLPCTAHARDHASHALRALAGSVSGHWSRASRPEGGSALRPICMSKNHGTVSSVTQLETGGALRLPFSRLLQVVPHPRHAKLVGIPTATTLPRIRTLVAPPQAPITAYENGDTRPAALHRAVQDLGRVHQHERRASIASVAASVAVRTDDRVTSTRNQS